jgi:3-deoxy-7-phosphoheptulonate synthase
VAVDAVAAAGAQHAFIGMTKMGQAAIFETRGNTDCHVILRGGKQPNHGAEAVAAGCAMLREAGLPPLVMVDVSHANSQKQHRRQIQTIGEIAERIAAGERCISGVMIESHLEEGRQDLTPGQPLRHGVSITDACIGWRQTAPLLQALAQSVRLRRQGQAVQV